MDHAIDDGHAWISYRKGGNTERYGLWPDYHEKINDTRPNTSDVRTGMEPKSGGVTARYFALTESEAAQLEQAVGEYAEFGYLYNCSAWASDMTERATGVRIRAMERMSIIGGAPTPRELGSNIRILESEDPTSSVRPTTVR